MKGLIFISLFLPLLAYADCETWTRFGEPQAVCWNNEFKAWLSEVCSTGCEAKTFLSKKAPKPERIDRTGGKNPATQYCKAFDLKVHVLKDPRKAEQSFCVFADGSMVDANAFSRSLR